MTAIQRVGQIHNRQTEEYCVILCLPQLILIFEARRQLLSIRGGSYFFFFQCPSLCFLECSENVRCTLFWCNCRINGCHSSVMLSYTFSYVYISTSDTSTKKVFQLDHKPWLQAFVWPLLLIWQDEICPSQRYLSTCAPKEEPFSGSWPLSLDTNWVPNDVPQDRYRLRHKRSVTEMKDERFLVDRWQI